jgi:UDP-N-acetylglucosamine--N-acetylmuramyl-(pentapeptide) pyrophosphoryl-undecaprenol N-acetylglucosamine transferase
VKRGRGIVIAGGGTGGHVVPSLQIARALVARGHAPDTIELFGSRRGQEATVWPPLEFGYRLLPGRGIRRSIRPAALWANLGAVLGLAWAAVAAVASFARRRPNVVVVVGGYASFAAGLAAVVTRVPLVLVHTDAVPGAVNALLVRFAAANAVAFTGTELPRAIVTGTPVQPELGALDRSGEGQREARRALGLPTDRMTVAVTGGSLGARHINGAVADLARRWSSRDDVSIYHVTGWRDYDQFAIARSDGEEPTDKDGGLRYVVVPYEDRMPEFYRAADVCVCRAGAMTVAELLAAGVPAILVPLPGAPRDHQTRNAEALVAAGAAILLPDDECDGARLGQELDALLADVHRLDGMARAGQRVAHRDAADKVAELVDAHAR